MHRFFVMSFMGFACMVIKCADSDYQITTFSNQQNEEVAQLAIRKREQWSTLHTVGINHSNCLGYVVGRRGREESDALIKNYHGQLVTQHNYYADYYAQHLPQNISLALNTWWALIKYWLWDNKSEILSAIKKTKKDLEHKIRLENSNSPKNLQHAIHSFFLYFKWGTQLYILHTNNVGVALCTKKSPFALDFYPTGELDDTKLKNLEIPKPCIISTSPSEIKYRFKRMGFSTDFCRLIASNFLTESEKYGLPTCRQFQVGSFFKASELISRFEQARKEHAPKYNGSMIQVMDSLIKLS